MKMSRTQEESMVDIHYGPLWKYKGRTGYAEYVETSAVAGTLYISGQAGYIYVTDMERALEAYHEVIEGLQR